MKGCLEEIMTTKSLSHKENEPVYIPSCLGAFVIISSHPFSND
jgi:hypothetical protein